MSDVELRTYIEKLLDERDKRYDERFRSIDKSIQIAAERLREADAKSELSIDKRFNYVNELRGALTDLSATMLTRDKFESIHESLENRIIRVEQIMQKSLIGYIIGAIGLVVAIITATAAWWNK